MLIRFEVLKDASVVPNGASLAIIHAVIVTFSLRSHRWERRFLPVLARKSREGVRVCYSRRERLLCPSSPSLQP